MGLFQHKKFEFKKTAGKDNSKHESFKAFLNMLGVKALWQINDLMVTYI